MDVKSSLNQCYYRMIIGDLRMMNDAGGDSISYNSALYLDLIAFQKNCTVSSIAEILHISKPAVTKKIAALTHQGLVEKTRSSDDKRVYYLSLTAKSKEVADMYGHSVAQAVRKIEMLYTQQQLETFCTILDTFSAEFSGQV